MTKCTHKQLMTACMLAGTLMLGACTGTPPVTKEVSIVPITNHLEETNGAFVLKSNTSIGVIDADGGITFQYKSTVCFLQMEK